MSNDNKAMTDGEIWKPVLGYEGAYSVSNMGRVRSEQRRVKRSDGRPRTIPCCILKYRVGDVGYPIVSLHKNGKGQTIRVHRVVLEAFVGPCPDGMECLHANNDKLDARLVNVRWGTHAENTGQMRDDGRAQAALGAGTAKKLDWADLHLILSDLAAGQTQQLIADRHGIVRQTVSKIARGEYWREHQSRKPEPEPGWFLGKPADMSPSAIKERRNAVIERNSASVGVRPTPK
jgi:hypothetical protein